MVTTTTSSARGAQGGDQGGPDPQGGDQGGEPRGTARAASASGSGSDVQGGGLSALEAELRDAGAHHICAAHPELLGHCVA